MAAVRDKIAAQDLILKAIERVAQDMDAQDHPGIADALKAERDRLAKKWGIS